MSKKSNSNPVVQTHPSSVPVVPSSAPGPKSHVPVGHPTGIRPDHPSGVKPIRPSSVRQNPKSKGPNGPTPSKKEEIKGKKHWDKNIK